MPDATVASIHLYPVKSCRGVVLDRARVGARGLEWAAPSEDLAAVPPAIGDRQWMIVDRDGRFVTQRELPRLALLRTIIDRGGLTLTAPGLPAIAVPLPPPGTATRDVIVWTSTVRAFDAGDAIADWLAAYLGVTLRLVGFDNAQERRCNPDYVGNTGAHTAFADGYPILIIGQPSLDDLNRRLQDNDTLPLPMNRFRPNIVLDGIEPYDEDHIDTIMIGAAVLRMVKPCTRCTITTTDQDSAAVGEEPLRILASYRMHEGLGGVAFGMNAIVAAGVGAPVAVGARATVTFRFDR
jgi:hypothetical protein